MVRVDRHVPLLTSSLLKKVSSALVTSLLLSPVVVDLTEQGFLWPCELWTSLLELWDLTDPFLARHMVECSSQILYLSLTSMLWGLTMHSFELLSRVDTLHHLPHLVNFLLWCHPSLHLLSRLLPRGHLLLDLDQHLCDLDIVIAARLDSWDFGYELSGLAVIFA